MGLFCVNFHFRGTNQGAVEAALQRRGALQHRVLESEQGWVSAYEQRASLHDEDRIRDLITGISRELRVPGIAFLVHDSDFACYWLVDHGRLIDEFNSCPDYFQETAGENGPSGGQAELVLPYCVLGWDRDRLESILNTESLFAEAILEQLAYALGIDVERALTDYRDLTDDEGPDSWGGFGNGDNHGGGDGDGGGEDGDGGDQIVGHRSWTEDHGGGLGDFDADEDDGEDAPLGGSDILPFQRGLLGQLKGLFGAPQRSAKHDPQVVALVQAAANDEIAEIDRQLAAGTRLDQMAPVPIPQAPQLAGFDHVVLGSLQLEVTPLLAAVLYRRLRAAEKLLSAGADPNYVHPMYGSAIHLATGAGQAELLQLLVDGGGSVSLRNMQGQTPLEILKASRRNLERLAEVQATARSMGIPLPPLVDQLAPAFPAEGWNACEQVLLAHGMSTPT